MFTINCSPQEHKKTTRDLSSVLQTQGRRESSLLTEGSVRKGFREEAVKDDQHWAQQR